MIINDNYRIVLILLNLSIIIFFTACSSSSESFEFNDVTVEDSNEVVQEIELQVSPNEKVSLTSNVQINELEYDELYWRQVNGPNVTLFKVGIVNPSFHMPITKERLSFEWVMIYQGKETVLDTVHINPVPYEFPIIKTVSHLTAREGDQLQISANIHDPDGEIVSIQWITINDQFVELEGANSSTCKLTVPYRNSSLYLQVFATDDMGLTSSNTIELIVINKKAPTISLQENFNAIGLDLLTLKAEVNDEDGYVTNVLWEQISGAEVKINNKNDATCSFIVPNENTTLSFRLTVTDNEGLINSQVITVTILKNKEPFVFAGNSLSFREGDLISIQAQHNDEDGTITEINWTQTKGGNVRYETTSTSNLSFIAPSVDETLTFTCTVKDDKDIESVDSIDISISTYKSPNLSLSFKEVVKEKEKVELNLSATDSDGNITQIDWKQLSGPKVDLELSDPTSVYFTAPTYDGWLTFSVNVRDNDHLSSSENISIEVQTFKIPTANAGTDLFLRERDTVTLYGQGTDLDGVIKTHAWSQMSGHSVLTTPLASDNLIFEAPSIDDTLIFEYRITDNDGYGHSDKVSVYIATYKTPNVDVGPSQIAREGEQVILSGRASDSDGNVIQTEWTQISGHSVALNDPLSITSNFIAPAIDEKLTFKLEAIDHDGLTSSNTLSIEIQSKKYPIVHAGQTQNVLETDLVTLSGNAHDLDGSITRLAWTQLDGEKVNLNGSNTQLATFNAPSIDGNLNFLFEAWDDWGLSSNHQVMMQVRKNIPPFITSIEDRSSLERSWVEMSVDANDTDGWIETIHWSQTHGTPVQLSSSNTWSTNFLAPTGEHQLTFKVEVIDDFGASVFENVDIEVYLNTAPVVIAGNHQTVTESSNVMLTATATDLDHHSLSIEWQQLQGSNVTLNDPTTLSTNFIAPVGADNLIFEVVAKDSLGAEHRDQVSIIVDYAVTVESNVTIVDYVPVEPIVYLSYDDLTDEDFEENIHGVDLLPGYNEINIGHFTFVWGNDYSVQPKDKADVLSQLRTDKAMQQEVIDRFSALIDYWVNDYGLNLSPTSSPNNAKFYRMQMYIYGTGLWVNDNRYYGGGGTICAGYSDIPNEAQVPIISLPSGILVNIATGHADLYTLTHELIHTFQCYSQKPGRPGWDWYVESIAQFYANDYQNANIFSAGIENEKFLALDTFFNRYASSPFWMYVREEFGYRYMGDIILRDILDGETLIDFLVRTTPFELPEDDLTERRKAFASFIGRYAASTVNYVASSSSEGVDYNSQLRFVDGRHRENAQYEKVGDSKYRIVDWLAPQRFARNTVELIRDPDVDELVIQLNGWDIPEREAEFRMNVVATLDSTTFPRQEAWSDMISSGTLAIDLNEWEETLGKSIQKLHLALAATPLNWKRDQELSGFSSPIRHLELDRYIYEVNITGAWPIGYQPHTLRTPPSVAGSFHPNGGGFVANTAHVDASAYVGPEARVLDQAQVLDQARIEGRAQVYGQAIVRDHAIISGRAKIYGSAILEDHACIRDSNLVEQTARVSDQARMLGDSIYYGTFSMSDSSMTMGAPLIWNTSYGLTLADTAIINGHAWLPTSQVSTGTPYDDWAIDAEGLVCHYNFEKSHPYRIYDSHSNSDAYHLNTTSSPIISGNILQDGLISSQVLCLDGNSYLDLPKHFTSLEDFKLEAQLYWSGESRETVFHAFTDQNESLQIDVYSLDGSGLGFDCTFKDRHGDQLTMTLENPQIVKHGWFTLSLSSDSSTRTLQMNSKGDTAESLKSQNMILPTPLRTFDYDSLKIYFGTQKQKTQFLKGRLDDLTLTRL